VRADSLLLRREGMNGKNWSRDDEVGTRKGERKLSGKGTGRTEGGVDASGEGSASVIKRANCLAVYDVD